MTWLCKLKDGWKLSDTCTLTSALQSVSQTLWPELTIWKLPCLKPPLDDYEAWLQQGKAKQWLMQFHARQWFLQLNLYWAAHVEKRAGRRQTDRGSNNAETGWGRGSLSRQRCFTMPDQIIELHLQYYHCRLTFLWVCEITHERLLLHITMRHTRPIPWKEELRIKEVAFPHYPVLRRSLMSHWQVKAVKTFCRPLKKILVTTLKHQTASRSPPEMYNELQRLPQKLTKFSQSLQCQ